MTHQGTIFVSRGRHCWVADFVAIEAREKGYRAFQQTDVQLSYTLAMPAEQVKAAVTAKNPDWTVRVLD
jgi:hypothetical protein